MNGRYFLDTNVLVYSFEPAGSTKRRVAEDLIRSTLDDGRGMISFQVVQEFCSVATRKFAQPFTTADLREYLQKVLAPLCEIQSSTELYLTCLNIQEHSGYSFYDSLILAAAVAGGCETLYSEDLQDGQTVAGVKIVNPF
ncbi:MAG TPA: PIN domain-containing protein [Thermoguttaceae bacterium]|nr:PIN domain-containing protein [Thermoguttaceae bacterium]